MNLDQIIARFQSGNSVAVDKATLPKVEFDYLIGRIKMHEVALAQWLDKTEWVQKTVEGRELGMHRADVLKQRIERLEKRLEIDPRTNYDGIDCRDATIRELERENAELRKDAARYKWLAWRSDTNPIMPYDYEADRFYFGHECDAAIDEAMKS